MTDNTIETALGGAKIKTICDNLTRVGFDWRAMCVEALIEAHTERARPIERAKETLKGAYCKPNDLGTFVRAVIAGTARIAFRSESFVKKYMALSDNEALDAIEREVLGRDNPWEFAEAMGEYTIRISWSDDAMYAVHRLAPPWKGDPFEEIKGLNSLDAACCLDVDVVQVNANYPIAAMLLDESLTAATKFPDSKVGQRAAEAHAKAHKRYAFAKTKDTFIGVDRSLLCPRSNIAGAHTATYPKETEAAMDATALFIVTDDATWGMLLLGRIKPAADSPTAEFLAKFRKTYRVELAGNAGGVICSRRE
jgi:hypothetical protein